MPTKRMITPAFWQSESIARLTPLQRLLFIGLFSNADDQGRLRGHPAVIRSVVFPYDDISVEQVENDLKAIESIKAITIYESEDKHCIQVTGWWKYQSPQWAYPSELPPPAGWNDRLRYRENNQVITRNWKGELDIINEEALGKALGKEQTNAKGEAIELGLDIGIDSTPNGVGEKSPETPPDKKPKAQPEIQPDDKPDDKKQLMGVFLTETRLTMPRKKNTVGFWWSNIREIYELADRDVDVGQRLIRQAVKALKDKQLTIGGPESIIKTCRALAAGQTIGDRQNGTNHLERRTSGGGANVDQSDIERQNEFLKSLDITRGGTPRL